MADVPVERQQTTHPHERAQPQVPDLWRSFRGDMDRMFDRMFERFGMPSLRRMFDMDPGSRFSGPFGSSAPPIDISEDENCYKIMAELPGLDAKDVDVSMSGDMLVIKGEKRQEKEGTNQNYHFSERSYGAFHRAFDLPSSVDRDKISADFSKGVLTITLPKTADAQKQPKKIEVKAGSS